jgi:hypothetical protein
MKYNITRKEGDIVSIAVSVKGKSLIVTPKQAQFKAVLEALSVDPIVVTDDDMVALCSPVAAIQGAFERLGDRVTVSKNEVRFDAMPVNNALTTAILKFYEEGNANWAPLVNFFEKIMTNMTPHSRDQAFTWLANKSYGIFADGDIVGYKYVGDGYRSSHAGHGFVNGVEYKHDHLPHDIGSIVEMPRDEVAHDPGDACSAGLHVGSWAYSSGSGRHMILVKINPRDIVSVPTDAGGGKMRVCRYHVIMDVTGQGNVLDKLGISFPNIELKTLLRGEQMPNHSATSIRRQRDVASWKNPALAETLPVSAAPAGVLDDGENDAHGEDVEVLAERKPVSATSAKPKRLVKKTPTKPVATKKAPSKKAAPVKKAPAKPAAKKAAPKPTAKVTKKAPGTIAPPQAHSASKAHAAKKAAPAPAKPKVVRAPKTYEDFGRANFEVCKKDELIYVANAWDVPHNSKTTHGQLVDRLLTKAIERKGARTTSAGKRKNPLTSLRG